MWKNKVIILFFIICLMIFVYYKYDLIKEHFVIWSPWNNPTRGLLPIYDIRGYHNDFYYNNGMIYSSNGSYIPLLVRL